MIKIIEPEIFRARLEDLKNSLQLQREKSDAYLNKLSDIKNSIVIDLSVEDDSEKYKTIKAQLERRKRLSALKKTIEKLKNENFKRRSNLSKFDIFVADKSSLVTNVKTIDSTRLDNEYKSESLEERR